MAKTELGVKRTCVSCGMRFYDFKRSPIVCPGCGKEFDLKNLAKTKKSREIKKVKTKEDISGEADFESESTNDKNKSDKTNVSNDDDIDFDEEDSDDTDDTDEPRIIRDDLSDDDPLLPNLDKKEE